MKYYLSVDSGGTKTDFLLTDEKGCKCAQCTLGPANYLVNGLDEVLRIYRKGIDEIAQQASISENEIVAAFIAMAGFGDIPEDVERVTKITQDTFPSIKIQLGNDTDNAISGSLLGESGIHVIAGTGSIGLGIDLTGRNIRSGGWHHLFGGDEGSGYWIGCQLLVHFTKQADGREEKTQLYDYLIDKYNLGMAENILDLVIVKWGGQRDKIASLSYDVSILASQNDPCALRIFEATAKELAQIINAIYHLGEFSETAKVSYSGGVFKSLQFFKNTLLDELDFKVDFVDPALMPLPGGSILAMKQDSIELTEEIIENLKRI